MPTSTRTYKDASGTSKTRVVAENVSSQDSGAVLLTDEDAAVLKGQKARDASLPMALSTEDAALLADLLTNTTFSAKDFATSAKQDALAALIGEVQASPTSNTVLDRLKAIATALGTLSLPSGASTAANQSTEIAALGGLTETAPATDTASSGLNGRLQRIAQRLTSLIALLPTSLGAGGGLKVDGSGTALPVSGTVAATQSGTWTVQPGNTANTTPWLASIHDGTNKASVRSLANNALNVAITDSSGAQISSFGNVTTVTATGTMTRPADTTTYAAGDGVTTATSSASAMSVTSAARGSGTGGVIFGGKATKSTTTTTNAQFRLWLYQDTPSAIPNDNAAFSAAVQADYQKLVGTALVDFSAGITGSDGVRVPITLERANMGFDLVSGTSITVIWEARAAYAPGNAEVFRLSLDIAQD